MDNNPICCLAELKIPSCGQADGALVLRPCFQHTKGLGSCWLWRGFVRRKAEEKRIEKFTLNEK